MADFDTVLILYNWNFVAIEQLPISSTSLPLATAIYGTDEEALSRLHRYSKGHAYKYLIPSGEWGHLIFLF